MSGSRRMKSELEAMRGSKGFLFRDPFGLPRPRLVGVTTSGSGCLRGRPGPRFTGTGDASGRGVFLGLPRPRLTGAGAATRAAFRALMSVELTFTSAFVIEGERVH